jgi:hypothetical protein
MQDIVYDDQIQVALEQTETAIAPSNEITLSSGVVLKRKDFPIMRIQAVAEQFPYPDVPKVYNEQKNKWEQWAGSAEYAKMVEETDHKRGLAVVDTIMAVGTEVVSVPDDFPTVDSEDWIDELLHGSGIKVKADSKTARYLAWVKYVAVRDEGDLAKIMEFASRQAGTSEVNVAEQLHTSFQDN